LDFNWKSWAWITFLGYSYTVDLFYESDWSTSDITII
jgi:hypothetical protein